MENYIVLDLEWNQSPDGKTGANEQIPFEIIEIGAVRLDKQFQIASEFKCLVRPQIYDQIHFKISEVTHMGMQELRAEGMVFQDAVREFFSWCGQDSMFCTWGPMDLTELQRNMAYYHITSPFPFPLLYYDVQKLYSLLYGDGKGRLSLDTAVSRLEIQQDRPFHRAADDAYYTARIMRHMEFDKVKDYVSVDYYRIPRDKKDEIKIRFPSYMKYVSRDFSSKEDAIADKTVTEVTCFQCRRTLRKKIRWFSSNQKYFFCLAWCPIHGFIKGKIRMKKTDDDKIFVVKTLKPVDEEGAQLIYQRKEELKKRRNEKSRMKKRR